MKKAHLKKQPFTSLSQLIFPLLSFIFLHFSSPAPFEKEKQKQQQNTPLFGVESLLPWYINSDSEWWFLEAELAKLLLWLCYGFRTSDLFSGFERNTAS